MQIERLSESDWLLRLGDVVAVDVGAQAQALASTLRAAELPSIEDIVPAYASVLLRAAPAFALQTSGEALPDSWRAAVDVALEAVETAASESPLRRIQVCYGGEFGTDLDALTDRLGMTAEEIVRRHCAPEYRVAMIGFAPGFAYLLGLDPALQVPRRQRPRTRVPAGSIGLAGQQTGIYPSELPGGWQLIGRTPLQLAPLTDPQRPCLLAPGDRVRFEPVDASRFAALAEAGDA